MIEVNFWLKCAGYCTSHKHFALRGSKWEAINFPATYGLIQHPTEGWILFDTGYTKRFFEETKRLPGLIYGKITPVFLNPEEEAVAELKGQGIAPEDVKHIIVSHFHADHTGGLKDFPNAQFYCSQEAFDEVTSLSGFRAVKKGILDGQIPKDLAERTTILSAESFTTTSDPDLGELIDLFDDGSILLASLPGHARGQIGAILRTPSQSVFLVADAIWLKESLIKGTLPHPIVKLFFDSWSDFVSSLNRVRNYHQNNPKTLIIPCHCEETMKEVFFTQNDLA